MKFHISKEYIKNTFIIAISFVLLKSFNLVLPYFLDKVSYNEFNKVFYYASLISTIGTFGFTYAITQINIAPFIFSLLVFGNIIISFFLVYVLGGVEVSIGNAFIIFLISFSAILFSVYNFRLLFFSKTNKYFISIVIISLSYFIALAVSFFVGIKLLFMYGILGLFGLIISFRLFDLGNIKDFRKLKKFYKLGFSTFIINSAAGMILMADKFFANNFFSVDVANSYTFAWALVAPIFYLGNIAEKNIYAAENKKSIKNALFNSFVLIAFGLIIYSFLIFFITNKFSNVLPNTIDVSLFKNIFMYMIIGYSLFIFFHFPINGILFKMNFHDSQKLTSYAYIFIIGIFTCLYLFNFIRIANDDYLFLISLVVLILVTLSVSKFLLIVFLHKKAIIGFVKR